MYSNNKPSVKFSSPNIPLVLWTLFFLIVIFTSLELIAKSTWIKSVIRFPSPAFYSIIPEMDVKFERLSRQSTINCMFFGSSMADSGLNPIIFEDMIRTELGADYTCFNMGFSGSMVETSGAVATTISHWYPLKLVVFGISAIEMDRNYLESRPVAKMPVFTYYNGEPTILGWLFNTADLPWYLAALSRLDEPDFQSGITSYNELVNDRGERVTNQVGKVISGKQDILLQDFEINPIDMDVLRSTIMKFKGQGIQVIIVEMPVHPALFPYLIDGGVEGYHQKFLIPLEETLSQYEIPFIQTQGEIADFLTDSYWANPNHLNYSGAELFTTHITKKMIDKGAIH